MLCKNPSLWNHYAICQVFGSANLLMLEPKMWLLAGSVPEPLAQQLRLRAHPLFDSNK